MNILILRILPLFYLLFSYSVAYSKENLNNVRVNSLNILKNNEINNLLNNKIISGFFSDGSDFREAYYSNNSYLFEMLSGQDKGQYEGKWGIDGDHICYLMQGSSNNDCVIIYWRQLNSGIYDIYYGDLQNVFAKITQIEDVPKNNLLKDLGNLTSNQSISNQNQTQSGQGTGTAPEGTQNISQEDIVNIDLNSYSISPSDKSLKQLNFNMTRDKVVKVLKNNGCKISANWKRRVITKGQKDTRDLKSKCFKKKMIVIGFEKNGVMEFIADTHYLGDDNKHHFIEDYDQNKSRVRIESFQRYAPNKIYNIGSRSAICLNKECMEMVYRNRLNKEVAFLYLNPKSTIAKEWAKKSIESFKLGIERPGNGCKVQQDNPCSIYKAHYEDPSVKYLQMFMEGPRTPERDSLRSMYNNLFVAQKLAAEALGLKEVAKKAQLMIEYSNLESTNLDMARVTAVASEITNELYKQVKAGSDNKEARKKIEEAHVYAAKAGNEGQIFFAAITAIFSSSSIESAIAATEVAARTKGQLNYFYKALREIREAKNVNLTPETKEEFGAAEDSITI